MRVSDVGIAMIKQFEGFRPKPYYCPSGVPTIGYGRTDGVTMDHPAVTEAEATKMLADDLAFYEFRVDSAVKVPLAQHEFDALVSLVFNIGVMAFRSSALIRYLNAGNRAAAAGEFHKWNKGRSGGKLVELSGLSTRRSAERILFEGREQ